jgi:hypothetical protein
MDKLVRAITPQPWWELSIPPLVHVARVRYDREEQKEWLRKMFDQYIGALSDTDDVPQAHIGLCADSIVKTLALHACVFKRPDFHPEQEWRIVIETLGGASDVSFRPSTDMLIPYMKAPAQPCGGPLPIESIVIGPSMNQDASKLAVQALLDKKKHRGVNILPAVSWTLNAD